MMCYRWWILQLSLQKETLTILWQRTLLWELRCGVKQKILSLLSLVVYLTRKRKLGNLMMRKRQELGS
uniref:Uncharacterized protein n=1 Tax=Arundo donax TaxID=35708 RepID=A0A0A9D3D7_ARUDO